jgi:hypothetical protein
MILLFHSLNQLSKTYGANMEPKFAYVTKINSLGGN